MTEEEIEEGGITIGQIFRTIFSQKWLALLIAAAITVVGTLGLYFLGKRNEVYSVSFVLQLPNTSETNSTSTSYTYPDGASFYFTDLISKQNLKEVASREGFKDIDVDKMVKKGDISISREVDKVTENSQNGVYDLSYTVKVKAKYFGEEDVARDFIEALISFPRDYISTMFIDYDQSLTVAKSLITYDGQLDALKEQAEFILTNYEELIAAYGTGVVVKEGKTLGFYQAQLQTFLKSTLDNLKTRALTNMYVMGDENGQPLAAAIRQYETDTLTKRDELNELQRTLDALYVGSDGQTSVIVGAEILECAAKKEKLQTEIDYYEKFTAESCTYNEEFDKEVKTASAKVEGFTKEFAEISSIVYKTKTTVNYLNASIIEVEGGRGLIMSVGISLIVGLILAAVVAYIVGWNKLKTANASQGTASAYRGAQIQATAEATKDDENKQDEK